MLTSQKNIRYKNTCLCQKPENIYVFIKREEKINQ